MTISYNWLCDYLPVKPSPEKLSEILTSIGLEVESLEKYESIKGGLKGLVIGEVVACTQHPDADKLKLTQVNVGTSDLLQIVCGAPNVAVGQKVVVAMVGTTIYPSKGEPMTMKVARIRGVESHGMICAEDEIGLGDSHAGIIILPEDSRIGIQAADYFQPYEDHIIEIGLTPNRMDAMSHMGVARDVCAYLSHHEQKEYKIIVPDISGFTVDNTDLSISVRIEDPVACERFSGLAISGIDIQDSPKWMQDKLRAIGIRPINNIVDITNFVLHETGQPLHAYDAAAIKGNQVIVKKLAEGTKFVTLDEKLRTLRADDLMICNASEGMCIAGVLGGLSSAVKEGTHDIFLESAWFNPSGIRKTSLSHNLRTDAAIHFEKGMDISNTKYALQRAALLIRSLAFGSIASNIVDEYPHPRPKTQVSISFNYLAKISGKVYSPESVKKMLRSLGFDLLKEGKDDLLLAVPFHKPDISLPADIVEEIMRIDGIDNISIPTSILISPSIETDWDGTVHKSNLCGYLVGQGFFEILTNSITNSAYFSEKELEGSVKMINSLSAELNVMRPSLLETGLESIAYNINRKNNNLRFFEFGKTYHSYGKGKYEEKNHLCLYVSGHLTADSWKEKGKASDLFYLKGICVNVFRQLNHQGIVFESMPNGKLANGLSIDAGGNRLLTLGMVHPDQCKIFDIRQPVFFADFDWDALLENAAAEKIEFRELPRQLPVYRDLALIVSKSVKYEAVEMALSPLKLDKLQDVRLFDIFESEKLGSDKKSMAISFTFLDEEKTLTDKEIDGMMSKIIKTMEEKLAAEIRK
jgi:phenylalanyl-tRNA synthetase beta chain